MDKNTTENSKLTREDIESRGWVINEELQNDEADKKRFHLKKQCYSDRHGVVYTMNLLFVAPEAWCLIYDTSAHAQRMETRFAGRIKDASIFDIITDAIGMNNSAPEHEVAIPTVETPDQCYKP